MVISIGLENMAVSEYELGWTDIGLYGERLCGLSAEGVMALSPEAEKPDGIVTWGMMAPFGGGAGFNVPAARIMGWAEGPVRLSTAALERGREVQRCYTFYNGRMGEERQNRELLARDADMMAVSLTIKGKGLQLSALELTIDRVQDWRF
jgi:hypothetical protein